MEENALALVAVGVGHYNSRGIEVVALWTMSQRISRATAMCSVLLIRSSSCFPRVMDPGYHPLITFDKTPHLLLSSFTLASTTNRRLSFRGYQMLSHVNSYLFRPHTEAAVR